MSNAYFLRDLQVVFFCTFFLSIFYIFNVHNIQLNVLQKKDLRTKVYCGILDAIKAFAKVFHHGVCKKLLDQSINQSRL